jgi:hypothetical protein
MPERRTVQFKAPIAGKTQSNRYAHGASFSKTIAKIGNAELAHFNKQMLIHELIRGSLNRKPVNTRRDYRHPEPMDNR